MTDKQIGQFTHRTGCRFCGSTNLAKILDFDNVPLAGAFLKEKDFAGEKFYPLDLSFCKDCTLIQVSNVVSAETLFKNYFYFSSSIKTLVQHFENFAGEVKEKFLRGVNNPSAFELGCNDGVFLKPLAALGIKAVGVDPATNVVNSVDSKNITIINDFFSEKLAQKIRKEHGPFDVVLSSYSFAHIDDMVSIIKGIKHLMKEDGVFIFEVYYLGTLIDEMQYDMIYHEHMSYYSLKALSTFLKRFGMEIFDVKFIPGVRSGAARFYARNIGKRPGGISPAVAKLEQDEKQKGFDKVDTFLSYASKVNGTREELLKVLEHLKKEGKTVIGYGASGRGTTIMNFCGINGRYLDYVVDDAPAKHSFFTPGTHVPIKPWEFTSSPNFLIMYFCSRGASLTKLKKGGLITCRQAGNSLCLCRQLGLFLNERKGPGSRRHWNAWPYDAEGSVRRG
jgi:SAM-dependent methyltransferase